MSMCICRQSSYRDLVRGSCQETSYYMDILYRDLVKRADCPEASYRDLARRSLMEILYRDLVQRAEVLLRDPVMEILFRQRPFIGADMRPTGVILQIFLSRCLSESFSRWRAHFPRLWKGFEIFSARDFSVTLLPRSLRCFLNEILLGCCCSFSLVGVRILAAGDGVRSIATCHSFGLCHATRAAEQLPWHRARALPLLVRLRTRHLARNTAAILVDKKSAAARLQFCATP